MKKQASFQCYFFLRTIIFVCLSSLCMISPIAHGIIYSNLQTQNDHFARFIHFTTQDGLCSNQILDIAQDKFGKIWFATQNGLTCFDGFHYNIYRNNIEQSNSISDNTITALTIDSDGNLWAGTQDGLNKFDYTTRTFTRYYTDKQQKNSLRSNHIKALYADKEGFLWIESAGGFLSRLNLKTQEWNHVSHTSLPTEGNYFYHHIFEDSNHNIWVDGRLTHIALIPGKEMKAIRHPIQNKDEVYFDPGCFVETAGKELLCSNYEGALGCYNPDSGFFHTILQIPVGATSAVRDDDGKIWIGGDLRGLIRIDFENQIYHNFQNNPQDNNTLLSNNVSCLYKDRDGNIWIGTDKGVSMYAHKYNSIRHYRKIPDANSPVSDHITALLQDHNGLIWVGTEKGLCQYNSPEDNFTRIKGLSDYIIKSIQEDSRQYLWVATGNGLFCLTSDGEIFRRFGKQHGFQDDEFTSASCRLRNGSLLFGGMHGFNLFDPSDFTEQVMPSPILFSNFKVKDKVCQTDIAPAGKFDLSYKENSFSIDFCALDFVDGPHLKYRYRLSGFDKNAIQTIPPFLNAKYTNIPPGDYTFEVEVCNRFGEWKNRQTFCFIHISTPWYRQFWFICLLIAFLGTSIYMLIRYRERKLRLNGIRLEKLIAKRTQALSEAIDSKNKFFSIISHDLKNPIQSLQLVAHNLYQRFDQMQDVEKRTIIRIIDETSGQTKMLLDNLLLWELSQQEILLPNYKKTELSKVTDTVMQTCLLTANKKNIRLINRIPPGIWVLTDSNMLETILRNLTGNAIKYSYPDSQIEINSQQDNNKIVVMVTDHGIGISEENQSNLFRPENKLQTKGTSQEQGNGLGLIIVQELLSKMGETIQVNSSPGRGSIFTFTLQKYSGT